jgi:transcriptional regulator with XRE-family HTH domain
MQLKNPDEVRQMLAERKGWYTMEEIAEGIDVSMNTISTALRGMPMRIGTVRKIADPLGVQPTEIATFVK